MFLLTAAGYHVLDSDRVRAAAQQTILACKGRRPTLICLKWSLVIVWHRKHSEKTLYWQYLYEEH